MRRTGLSDLPAAVEWLRQAWDTRDTPNRLHEREHDGWGLMYAPAFARRLGAKPDDKRHDHAAPFHATDACPWRYPTWRALVLLRAGSEPSYEAVMTLVINGYSVRACARIGYGSGALLTAIRRLFACYELAPVRVAYTQKSEAQRTAEAVA
jgi:hypothetical protein